MDASNQADMTDQAPTVAEQSRVRLFREFDPEADARRRRGARPLVRRRCDGFAAVLAMIERTTDHLVEQLPDLMES